MAEFESPYKSGYSNSKEQRQNDLYYSESGKKHGYLDSDSKYDALKSSERQISSHLDRAAHYQDERLNDEVNANQFYKRELENIRSELNKKRNKVQSNHFSTDEDYLLQSTKERIKNLQYLREQELSERFESPQPERANFSSAEKSNQKYKYEGEEGWQNRTEDKWKASHLTESVGTNKTYDLSQSLRGSSNEYREKVTGGLKNLEEKMNLMEKELDEHLSHRNKEYFTNKELVKQRQKQREQELQYEKENTDQDDEEEEAMMESMQKKGSEQISKFKSVFDKREERLEHDQQEIERESARRNEEQREQIQDQDQDQASSELDDQIDVERKRAFEEELEFLKAENDRIKNELLTIKDNYETQKQYGEVKVHAADILTQEANNTSYVSNNLKTSTRVIREPAKLKSNKTFAEIKENESINNTIKRAKKQVQNKLTENKLQREKSLNKKKNPVESQKKQEFMGVRNELYQKYYGYPVHTKEASYFLSKGIPTSYMSDARREVAHNDPATTLPKRFAKAMKY